MSAAGGASLRRVLRRARDGVALNVDEAAVAMTARGDDLTDLCASAARVRDAGLRSAGRFGPGGGLPVTYSRKVFIPVTHLCRDTATAAFVTVPGKLPRRRAGMYLELDAIVEIARRGSEMGCKEALFTLGDRPEARWPEARGGGWTNGATTRPWTTSARPRCGFWRRPGCCPISTPG